MQAAVERLRGCQVEAFAGAASRLQFVTRLLHDQQPSNFLGQRGCGSGSERLPEVGQAALVRALNDGGPLGASSRALLRMEQAAFGGVQTMSAAERDRRFLRGVQHLHFTNRISLLSSAGLQIATPQGDLLASDKFGLRTLLQSLPQSPEHQGRSKAIPSSVYLPLLELGIHNLEECTNASLTQQHFLAGSELAMKLGKVVKNRHKLALNRLTLFLNKSQKVADPMSWKCAKDLPRLDRELSPAHTTTPPPPTGKGGLWQLWERALAAQQAAGTPSDNSQATAAAPDEAGLFEKQAAKGAFCLDLTSRKKKRGRKDPLAYGQRVVRDDDLLAEWDAYYWETNKRELKRLQREHREATQAAAAAAAGRLPAQEAGPMLEESSQTSHAELPQRGIKRQSDGAPAAAAADAADVTFEDMPRPPAPLPEGDALDVLAVIDASLSQDLPASISKRNTHKPPEGLTSLEQFIAWITLRCTNAAYIRLLYSHQDRLQQVLSKSSRRGQLGYNVQWAPTFVLQKHVASYTPEGYTAAKTAPLTQEQSVGLQAPGEWVQVSWEPNWEPESSVGGSEESIRLIKEMEARLCAPSQQERRQDAHLSNQQQQGNWPPAPPANTQAPLLTEPHLRDLICLNPRQQVNPDHDIDPTGQYEALPSSEREGVCKLYAPDGSYMDSISASRLATLRQALGPQTEAPLAQEVARLLVRQKASHKLQACGSARKGLNMAAPEPVLAALISSLQLETELFASPLDFHPGMRAYYSQHSADSALGANHNAYSAMWRGRCFCHPPLDDQELNKAVRWAILSAEAQDEPVLIALMLPSWPTSAYRAHLGHPSVQHLATVPKADFKYQSEQQWRSPSAELQSSAWDVDFLVISNASGRAERWDAKLQAACAALSMAIRGLHNDRRVARLRKRWRAPGEQQVFAPKKFAALREKGVFCTPKCWHAEALAPPDGPPGAAVPPLRYSSASWWFTDGSKRANDSGAEVIGAGAHCAEPAQGQLSAELRINCCGTGATNTITRAELVAIAAALAKMGCERDEIIASDSQASICLIAKCMDSGRALRESKHRELLEHIVGLLIARAREGWATSLVKVKSHIGITGNERADALANQATDPAACNESLDIGSRGLTGMYWPVTQPAQQAAAGPQRGMRSVSDLTKAVKEAVMPSCRTGLANETQYVQFWRRVSQDILPQSLEAPWNSAAITHAMLRNTLKARWGQLWNMNLAFVRSMAYRPGLPVARDNACPLCRQPDSCAHILGGCSHPDMVASYIARHNEAGRLILKAIQEGPKGNHYTIADLGCEERLEAAGLSTQGSRLPSWLISEDSIQRLNAAGEDQQQPMAPEDRSKLRPDILVLDTTTEEVEAALRKRGRDGNSRVISSCSGSRRRKVRILEFGYASDTRYHDKQAQKVAQHDRLCRLLAAEGYEVEYKPVVLGTQGGVFKCAVEALTAMGVPRPRQLKLLNKLTIHAIHSLQSIVKQRRFLERQPFPAGARRSSRQAAKPPD